MEPSLIGSASAKISMGLRFLGAASSDMSCEPNSCAPASDSPGGDDRARREDRPARRLGRDAQVRRPGGPGHGEGGVAGRMAQQAEGDGLVPLDRPQLVGPALVQGRQRRRDEVALPRGQDDDLGLLGPRAGRVQYDELVPGRAAGRPSPRATRPGGSTPCCRPAPDRCRARPPRRRRQRRWRRRCRP